MSDDATFDFGINDGAFLRGLGSMRDELGRFSKGVADASSRGAMAVKAAESGLGGLSSKVRTLRPALEDAGKGAAAAGGGLKAMQVESAQLMRLQALLGPQLGSMVKTLGMIRGTQASGLTGATLALGAFAAGLAAIAAVGGSAISVYADVAAYQSQIEHAKGEGLVTAQEVENIHKASIAYDGLTKSLGDFQISLAGDFAKDFQHFSLGLDYVLSRIEGFNADDATERAKKFHDQINGIADGIKNTWTPVVGGTGHLVTADEQKAKDAAAAAAAAKQATADAAALTAAKARSVAEANTWIWLMDTMDADTAATAKSEADTWAWLGAQLDTENKASADAAIAEMNRQHNHFVAVAEHNLQVTIDAEAKKREALAATKAAIEAQVSSAISFSGSMMSELSQLASNLAETNGESAMEQWKDQHAAAVATGAINIPLATVAGYISGGAYGAIAGAALAIAQEAVIVSTPPPKLHTGGSWDDAPDERTILRSEVPVMMTPEGARNRDGIAKQNAGLGGGGDNYYFLLPDSTVKAKRIADPRPGLAVSTPGQR